VLLGLIAVLQLGSADPRIGSWTLVSAHSTLDPANKLSITAVHERVHVVMSGDTHLEFTAKFDGHDAPVAGNPGFNEVQGHRIDKKRVEVQEKKDGAVVATLRSKLSSDNKELTITTASPGHPDQITVWTRSGGAKVANDPLAGEWTEDLSESRMRQGQTLKITADMSGAVDFLGDYSYAARFDGKAYDVQNSRNDTVTLALIDAHTVEATFRRDDQVSQTDRWVVSTDGRQMTLSSTAVLETGQHLNEKLEFKRQ
jgi:hypothetical protein